MADGSSVTLVPDEDTTVGALVTSTTMPIVASVSGSSVATEASVSIGSPELGTDSVVVVISKLDVLVTLGVTGGPVTSETTPSDVASVTKEEIVIPGDSVSKPSVAMEASVMIELTPSASVVTPSVGKEISMPSGLVVTGASEDSVSGSSVTTDGKVLDGLNSVSGATVLIVEMLSVTGITVLGLVPLAVSVADAPIGEMVVAIKLSGTSAAISHIN